MLANSGPAELMSLVNPERGVEEHRLLFCPRYDECLDEAIEKQWISWTCSHCALFASPPAMNLADGWDRSA